MRRDAMAAMPIGNDWIPLMNVINEAPHRPECTAAETVCRACMYCTVSRVCVKELQKVGVVVVVQRKEGYHYRIHTRAFTKS